MRRAADRFGRLRRRLEWIRAASLTPERKRLAWGTFQATGQLPDDPDLRELAEHLRDAEQQCDQIHQPAPEE